MATADKAQCPPYSLSLTAAQRSASREAARQQRPVPAKANPNFLGREREMRPAQARRFRQASSSSTMGGDWTGASSFTSASISFSHFAQRCGVMPAHRTPRQRISCRAGPCRHDGRDSRRGTPGRRYFSLVRQTLYSIPKGPRPARGCPRAQWPCHNSVECAQLPFLGACTQGHDGVPLLSRSCAFGHVCRGARCQQRQQCRDQGCACC